MMYMIRLPELLVFLVRYMASSNIKDSREYDLVLGGRNNIRLITVQPGTSTTSTPTQGNDR